MDEIIKVLFILCLPLLYNPYRIPCPYRLDDPNIAVSEEQESFILIHALRDANLPKFIAEDVPLFESILADLFPGIDPPAPDYGVLEV